MSRKAFVSTFFCGTMTTTTIYLDEVTRDFIRLSMKQHYKEFPHTKSMDVIACINLTKIRVLRPDLKLKGQVQTGCYVWLVSKSEWNDFVEHLIHLHGTPVRYGRSLPYRSPASLSPKQLHDFVTSFCEHNKYSLNANLSTKDISLVDEAIDKHRALLGPVALTGDNDKSILSKVSNGESHDDVKKEESPLPWSSVDSSANSKNSKETTEEESSLQSRPESSEIKSRNILSAKRGAVKRTVNLTEQELFESPPSDSEATESPTTPNSSCNKSESGNFSNHMEHTPPSKGNETQNSNDNDENETDDIQNDNTSKERNTFPDSILVSKLLSDMERLESAMQPAMQSSGEIISQTNNTTESVSNGDSYNNVDIPADKKVKLRKQEEFRKEVLHLKAILSQMKAGQNELKTYLTEINSMNDDLIAMKDLMNIQQFQKKLEKAKSKNSSKVPDGAIPKQSFDESPSAAQGMINEQPNRTKHQTAFSTVMNSLLNSPILHSSLRPTANPVTPPRKQRRVKSSDYNNIDKVLDKSKWRHDQSESNTSTDLDQLQLDVKNREDIPPPPDNYSPFHVIRKHKGSSDVDADNNILTTKSSEKVDGNVKENDVGRPAISPSKHDDNIGAVTGNIDNRSIDNVNSGANSADEGTVSSETSTDDRLSPSFKLLSLSPVRVNQAQLFDESPLQQHDGFEQIEAKIAAEEEDKGLKKSLSDSGDDSAFHDTNSLDSNSVQSLLSEVQPGDVTIHGGGVDHPGKNSVVKSSTKPQLSSQLQSARKYLNKVDGAMLLAVIESPCGGHHDDFVEENNEKVESGDEDNEDTSRNLTHHSTYSSVEIADKFVEESGTSSDVLKTEHDLSECCSGSQLDSHNDSLEKIDGVDEETMMKSGLVKCELDGKFSQYNTGSAGQQIGHIESSVDEPKISVNEVTVNNNDMSDTCTECGEDLVGDNNLKNKQSSSEPEFMNNLQDSQEESKDDSDNKFADVPGSSVDFENESKSCLAVNKIVESPGITSSGSSLSCINNFDESDKIQNVLDLEDDSESPAENPNHMVPEIDESADDENNDVNHIRDESFNTSTECLIAHGKEEVEASSDVEREVLSVDDDLNESLNRAQSFPGNNNVDMNNESAEYMNKERQSIGLDEINSSPNTEIGYVNSNREKHDQCSGEAKQELVQSPPFNFEVENVIVDGDKNDEFTTGEDDITQNDGADENATAKMTGILDTIPGDGSDDKSGSLKVNYLLLDTSRPALSHQLSLQLQAARESLNHIESTQNQLEESIPAKVVVEGSKFPHALQHQLSLQLQSVRQSLNHVENDKNNEVGSEPNWGRKMNTNSATEDVSREAQSIYDQDKNRPVLQHQLSQQLQEARKALVSVDNTSPCGESKVSQIQIHKDSDNDLKGCDRDDVALAKVENEKGIIDSKRTTSGTEHLPLRPRLSLQLQAIRNGLKEVKKQDSGGSQELNGSFENAQRSSSMSSLFGNIGFGDSYNERGSEFDDYCEEESRDIFKDDMLPVAKKESFECDPTKNISLIKDISTSEPSKQRKNMNQDYVTISETVALYRPYFYVIEGCCKGQYHESQFNPSESTTCLLWAVFQLYTKTESDVISRSIKVTHLLHMLRDAGLVQLAAGSEISDKSVCHVAGQARRRATISRKQSISQPNNTISRNASISNNVWGFGSQTSFYGTLVPVSSNRISIELERLNKIDSTPHFNGAISSGAHQNSLNSSTSSAAGGLGSGSRRPTIHVEHVISTSSNVSFTVFTELIFSLTELCFPDFDFSVELDNANKIAWSEYDFLVLHFLTEHDDKPDYFMELPSSQVLARLAQLISVCGSSFGGAPTSTPYTSATFSSPFPRYRPEEACRIFIEKGFRKEDALLLPTPFQQMSVFSLPHEATAKFKLNGVGMYGLWEQNIEQMRAIYAFYSYGGGASRRQSMTAKSMKTALSAMKSSQSAIDAVAVSSVHKDQTMLDFEKCKSILQNFQVYPHHVDFKTIQALYRYTKLWEWSWAEDKLSYSSNVKLNSPVMTPKKSRGNVRASISVLADREHYGDLQYPSGRKEKKIGKDSDNNAITVDVKEIKKCQITTLLTFRGFIEFLTRVALYVHIHNLENNSQVSYSHEIFLMFCL